MQFSSLQLASPLLQALTDEAYVTPTPIQAKAIPPVLEGRDLLGCAQTGTGKTAAFALPILHRLLNAPVDKTRRGPTIPRVLVLAPTRELAVQIGDSFGTYGRHTGLSCAVVFGGVSQFHQVKALQRGADIVVATPGRLMDLMEQRLVNLSAVNVFVLDEADRMLDMGFILPIRRIAGTLPAARQTLLFSATMPKDILKLAESMLRNPVRVSVTPVASTVPLIQQSVYMVPRMRKQALLQHLLEDGRVVRALVFTRTKHGADVVTRRLNHAGICADAIHGNKAQNRRQRALEGFRNGSVRVLVATDVASRGIDVDEISHVFNFDLPHEPEAYVHRIGRTGRAGATGTAISFCDNDERGSLRDIEKLTGKRVPAIVELPNLPTPAFVPDERRRDNRRPAQPRQRPHAEQRGHSDKRSGAAPHGHSNQRTPAAPHGHSNQRTPAAPNGHSDKRGGPSRASAWKPRRPHARQGAGVR